MALKLGEMVLLTEILEDVRAENRAWFSCGPGDGEKFIDPWASGRKGRECPQEIWTKKFMFMLFFFPDFQDRKNHESQRRDSALFLRLEIGEFLHILGLAKFHSEPGEQ